MASSHTPRPPKRKLSLHAADAELFHPKTIKKVPKGSIFCIKGENVRVCMKEKLFAAFTLGRHLQSTFSKGKGPTMSKAKRFAPSKPAGKGAYSPSLVAHLNSCGKSSRVSQFCKAERFPAPPQSQETPCVGQYHFAHLQTMNPARLRSGRFLTSHRDQHHQIQKVEEKPGPGDYLGLEEPSTCHVADWEAYTSERFRDSRTLGPGPMAYKAKPLASKCYGIPRAPCRGPDQIPSYKDLNRESRTAGPGEYNPRHALGVRDRAVVSKKWLQEVKAAG